MVETSVTVALGDGAHNPLLDRLMACGGANPIACAAHVRYNAECLSWQENRQHNGQS